MYSDPLRLLTRKEVSELTQIPIGTIDYYTSTGQIPFIRLGTKNSRFHPMMIVDWYAERLGVKYSKPQCKPKPRKGREENENITVSQV
jgi:predicted DNA-binding transcriptional regulator AlpA